MLEAEKYEALWERQEYRTVAPGEHSVLSFLEVASPKLGDKVIDFGCGTGRGAQKLKDSGLDVTGIDFAGNCLDPDVRIPLVKHDLTEPVPLYAKFGYCTDVLEHIPPEDVDKVVRNVTRAAKLCYFQISCVDDVMGALVGEPLHLSVHDLKWWKETFERLGCKVLWSEDFGHTCRLYVTAWADGVDLAKNGKLNVDEEKIRENIRINSNKGYKTVQPHVQQDVEVIILAGGPSMAQFEDDIRQKREAGMPLITVNGAYNWAISKGLKPSAQIVVDARPFNKRFVEPVVEGCKYLLASQCDPSLFESVPKDQVYLWHSAVNEVAIEYVKSVSPDTVWPVPGGSTVVLRSIPLLRMLGFPKFHIYGFDSCVMETHHSYAQPENDTDVFLKVRVGDREFTCTPWMISQAEEFKALAQRLDDDAQLAVYGDGLIAHIIKTAASKD